MGYFLWIMVYWVCSNVALGLLVLICYLTNRLFDYIWPDKQDARPITERTTGLEAVGGSVPDLPQPLQLQGDD